ncbi:fibronectin type III domain-containing protein [Kribbella sp. CA-293567]|uniref:fibronectin type III domain-containing protein n=1 Tax=Kribbella sp. CA-293567 TaxID=3002436 RepID=UPI0022DD0F57|nr:fibronectin type III domain-containing protein [Kribbella sp. CA-293567]WBQ02723.1 fibronectin type III domain-containing protein [Kribbella sp. CA-293567]
MRLRRMTAALAAAGLALAVVPALPATSTGASLTAVPGTTWQTDAAVLGLAVAKGKAFVGGRFTRVRPPGAAAGTNQTVRTYLAAFNQTTGALDTGFNHTLNNTVWSIVASPDGTKIYIGGDFTRVDGQVRNRIAAFDATTGALLPNIRPNVSYRVKTVAVGGDSLYFGGSFGLVNNVARNRAAAISTVDGSLLPWNPNADADVYAIDAADDNSKVYLGGTFARIGGISRWAVASVNNSTGALLPFAAASAVPLPSSRCTSRVKDIETSGDVVYFANAGDGGGCFDGTWAANIGTGSLIWKNTCLGATEAITMVNGWLFKGSHAHSCPGAFPDGTGAHFLLLQNPANGNLGPWFPNTNAGPPTEVGPLVSATGGSDLWVGGDFTKVMGANQQGLTRFNNLGAGAKPLGPVLPTLSSTTTGQVRATVQTSLDNDDITLTYRLLRGGSNTVVATTTANSTFWSRPTVTLTDTTAPSGTSQQYRIEVYDGNNVVRGGFAGITVR